MRAFPTVLSPLFVAGAALAQCPFVSLAVQGYGVGCNAVFGAAPTAAFGLDTTACEVQATVNATGGCCNTYLIGRLLALGGQQTAIPVPQLGPGCTLLTSSDILLFQPNSAGPTFTLTLPPVLPPLTFYAQGGALYFTTIGFSYDFALTAGSEVTLQ